MDPLGVESLNEPTKTDNILSEDVVPWPEKGTLQEPVKPPPTLSSGEVPIDSPEQQDHFNDIFGDFVSPANRSGGDAFSHNQSLFGSEDLDGPSVVTQGEPDMSSLAKLELAARETDVSRSSSLFDDLLDFSTPGNSDLDQILQDNMTTDQKPVAPVDLLFGVDLDLPVSPSNEMTDSKVKTPDILDFVDICNDLPEVSLTDVNGGLLVCEPVTDDWNLVTEVSSSPSHLVQPTPDIVVTTCGENVQSPEDGPSLGLEQQDKKMDEQVQDKKTDEQVNESLDNKEKDKDKPEENCNTESADKVEKNSLGRSDDLDFSVIELRPAKDTLNFDHSKHRRSISMKGSIANRKRPKRATILAQNEGGIFADSTEPKQSQQEAEDEADGSQRITTNSSQSETSQEVSRDVPELTSPSRKPTGGIKIPGLLEGLNKSKVFNKSDKSPVRDQAVELQTSSPPSVSAAHKLDKTSFPPAAATKSPNILSSPPLAASAPVVGTKPLVLPRVLPKPTTKTFKETQNQTTTSTGVSRAASFRTSTTTALSAEHPSLLKGSTSLSRSASVKVPAVSATNKPQSPFLAELKTSTHNTADHTPPKEEANKPVSPSSFRAANKTPPPPVPAKPTIAAKPRKISLGPSTVNQSAPLSAFSSTSSQSALRSTLLTKGQSPLQSTQTKGTKLEPEGTTQSVTSLECAAARVRPDSSSSASKTAPNSVVNKTKPTKLAVNGHNGIPSPSQNKTEIAVKNTTDKTDTVNISSNSTDVDLVGQPPTSSQQPPFGVTKPQSPGLFHKSENTVTTNLKELEPVSKELKVDIDDVFGAKDGSEENTSTQTRDVDVCSSDNMVSSEVATCDSAPHRKSSISGVSHVRYPSITDKPVVVNVGRKGSVSGSAYNPIGFRPTIGSGSSDGEQRSRGNSVSNVTDGTSPSALVTTNPFKAEEVSPSGSQRSQNGSINVSTSALEESTKSSQNNLDKTDSKPPKITAVKPTPGIITKQVEDKKKETAKETNLNIKDQAKAPREASPHSSSNGKTSDVPKEVHTADRKSSPWNVQLKKVERKDAPVPDPAVKVTSSSTVNWRQQLSQRQKPAVPPKEGIKSKSESAPDWAKTSIKRRQRLIESGVIQGDS